MPQCKAMSSSWNVQKNFTSSMGDCFQPWAHLRRGTRDKKTNKTKKWWIYQCNSQLHGCLTPRHHIFVLFGGCRFFFLGGGQKQLVENWMKKNRAWGRYGLFILLLPIVARTTLKKSGTLEMGVYIRKYDDSFSTVIMIPVSVSRTAP